MAHWRVLAEDSNASGAYLGIAAIITAATGLVGALVSLIRVLRAPTKHREPPQQPAHHHIDEEDSEYSDD